MIHLPFPHDNFKREKAILLLNLCIKIIGHLGSASYILLPTDLQPNTSIESNQLRGAERK